MAEGVVGIIQSAAADRQIDNETLTNRDGVGVYRQRVAVAASLDRVISEYTAAGLLEYVGFNAQSALVADTDWLVYKLFYSGTNLIDKQVKENIAWTARATAGWRSAGGD